MRKSKLQNDELDNLIQDGLKGTKQREEKKEIQESQRKVLMIYFRKKESMEREKIRQEKYYEDRISRT